MKARKRFGQHFLSDPGVLERIIRAMRPLPSEQLLEIGPGQGALTEYLVREVDAVDAAGRYVAVEIDRDLVPFLKARFPRIDIVNADILRVDLRELFANGPGWRVVGNLPYNISTPLLVLLLKHLPRIRDMYFMLQREVAERLAAVPGTKAWGRLTVLMQYHCQVEHLFDVAPESFTPPPRVWSAVIRVIPRSEKPPVDLDRLDIVLRHAFSQRRKRLANALQLLSIDWPASGVDPGLRADAVSVAGYVALARGLATDGLPGGGPSGD